MRRIINGKRYDTEAPGSTFIAEDWSAGLGKGDFRHYHERLYRTSHGNWFLHGEGGAMTRWAQSAGQNAWTSGAGIRPMTPAEALQWLEHAGETSAIERYFSDSVEDA